jgi:hypothetical protein
MTTHQPRPGDLDRAHDPIAYELQKHGEAVANQAVKLRGAVLRAHRAEWTEDKIAHHAGLSIEQVQRLIEKAEALERHVFGEDAPPYGYTWSHGNAPE